MLLLSLLTLLATTPLVKAPVVPTLYISPASHPAAQPGSTVTFQVKVANMDPFSGWDIMVNSTDTDALNPSDFSITPNLFAANFSQSPLPVELTHCVNNIGTGCNAVLGDGQGVVHSAAALFGLPPMSTPVSGVLFTITYTVGSGASSTIGIFNDVISNGTPNDIVHATNNGIYGLGRLINIDFTWNPTVPIQGLPVVFNASTSSDSNPGGRIISYSWSFGDHNDISSVVVYTSNSTVQHVYKLSEGRPLQVLLFVTDNLGFKNLRTRTLQGIQKPFHDLLASGIRVSPTERDRVLAGTILTIEPFVVNNGTFPETGFNVSVSVDGGRLDKDHAQFTAGNLTRGGTWIPRFTWDTSGLAPGTYEIRDFVPFLTAPNGTVIEKTTSNNMAVHLVRIVDLFQASFIPFTAPEFAGLIVVVLVAVVVARMLMKRTQLKTKRLSEELA